MAQALTTAMLRADFVAMTDDLPVTFVYGSESVTATFDPIATDPVNDLNGFLQDVRMAVWVPIGGSDGLTAAPPTNKTCTVDGTEYLILHKTDEDNSCVKVYLGDVTL